MGVQVKRCPGCGRVNDQFSVFCVNPDCKASLLNVQAERVSRDNGGAAPPSSAHEGPVEEQTGDAEDCSARDADEVAHTERLPRSGAQLCCTEDDQLCFSVYSGAVVGREGDVDVGPLPRSNYISRRHVRLSYDGERWRVENLSRTNPTLVNGGEIPSGERHPLTDGDEIILANTRLTFRERGR